MPTKQPKMNPAEHRRVKRDVVAQQPKGTLQLHIENRCLEVVRIRDVSPFGVCLQLPAAVDRGAQIRLTYTHNGIQIEALGTVVWQKVAKSPDPNPPDGHLWWVGIFLHPSSWDANFALHRMMMENHKDWPLDESGNDLY